jgi:hypothetical protein
MRRKTIFARLSYNCAKCNKHATKCVFSKISRIYETRYRFFSYCDDCLERIYDNKEIKTAKEIDIKDIEKFIKKIIKHNRIANLQEEIDKVIKEAVELGIVDKIKRELDIAVKESIIKDILE